MISAEAQRLAELKAYLTDKVPQAVFDELDVQIDKETDIITTLMLSRVPQKGIEIGKTNGGGGAVPAGAVTFSTKNPRGRAFARVGYTVYALGKTMTGRGGVDIQPGPFPAIARWVEFGTAQRFTTGKRTQPAGLWRGKLRSGQSYFFSSYRERKRAIKTNITRAIKRGLQRA